MLRLPDVIPNSDFSLTDAQHVGVMTADAASYAETLHYSYPALCSRYPDTSEPSPNPPPHPHIAGYFQFFEPSRTWNRLPFDV